MFLYITSIRRKPAMASVLFAGTFAGNPIFQGFSFYRFYLLHIYTFCVLRLQVLFLNSSYRHDHKPLIKKRKKSLSVLWAALWN